MIECENRGIGLRIKWDEQKKLRLGKLIRDQLDMQISLREAVNRAAEVLQAPKSTCMLYWQKELKNIDYSKEPLTLPKRTTYSVSKPPILMSEEMERDDDSSIMDVEITDLVKRLKVNEMKVRDQYLQMGLLFNEYSTITRELMQAVERRGHARANGVNEPLQPSSAIDIGDLAPGDIIRIHHHIWQEYYYISWVEDNVVKGYKLNKKNMMIRRNSKEKIITIEMLHFVKLMQRNVRFEDVFSD